MILDPICTGETYHTPSLSPPSSSHGRGSRKGSLTLPPRGSHWPEPRFHEVPSVEPGTPAGRGEALVSVRPPPPVVLVAGYYL